MGAVGRGRKGVVTGALVFGLLGYAGQRTYTFIDEVHSRSVDLLDAQTTQSLWHRVLSSKWAPIKPLSDEEYRRLLTEKVHSTDLEIDIIERSIRELRHSSNCLWNGNNTIHEATSGGQDIHSGEQD